MKRLPLLIAVLLAGWALQARAADYFAAVDASPLTLWKAECHWVTVCPGSSYDAHSSGYGARAGFWLVQEDRDKSGMEIGYARLGSTSGSTDYFPGPGCTLFCAGATASWHNDTSIAYAALMGQAYLGPKLGSEAVTGKIGVYHASASTTGNLGTGGPDYMRKVNSTGLMMGASYAYGLTPSVSLTLSGDLFFSVQVANPTNANGNISQLLLRLAVGAEYSF
jgi:hypothetical protein